jgi:23S rRNA pseudouridine1911/1915/1917 synthase
MTRKSRAIVVGEVTDPAARIEAPIGRDPKNRQRMAVIAGGREAVTEFRRLAVAGGHSLLDVTLGTGRTHQIRVHLAYIHHPVLGDPVYGRRSPLIARPALHAEALTLRHPRTGKTMSWQTLPPADFELAWNSLANHPPQPKMR